MGGFVIYGLGASISVHASLTVVSPTDGARIAPHAPIVVDVESGNLVRAAFTGGAEEVVYRNGAFAFQYLNSTKSTLGDGLERLTIIRTDGWPTDGLALYAHAAGEES